MAVETGRGDDDLPDVLGQDVVDGGSRRQYNRVHAGVRDGRIVLLKVCSNCGEEKICAEGPESEFWKADQRNGKRRWHATCRECASRKRRERHAERMATEAEYRERHNRESMAAHLRWLAKPGGREKARQSVRAYHERIRQEDPERLREESRLGYALRRERAGKPVRSPRPTVIDGTQPRILAGPFFDWLTAFRDLADLPDEALARSLGMTERRLRSVLAREYERVSMDVVDRALTNAWFVVDVAGRPVVRFDDLYAEGL